MEKITRQIAEHLSAQEFVEIYAHHNVDGIAAASILCHCLHRTGGGFRVRIVSEVTSEMLRESPQPVLCDLGSGMPDIPDHAVVIDHHVPHYTGGFHVNPRLFGLNGEKELSASGTAYLIAQSMGDNRDLVGLALLGMLGDRQEMTGKNREILHEGIAHQYLSTGIGFLLPGRDPTERLALAIDPYLEGLSGNKERCRKLSEECMIGGEVDEELLVSRVLMEVSPKGSLRTLLSIFGIRYILGEEILPDASTLAALVDACGKAGASSLGVALCLRDAQAAEEAWQIMSGYRSQVIGALRTVQQLDEHQPWFQVTDTRLIGSVADALAFDLTQDKPVAVFSPAEGKVHVSLRTPEQVSCNLESIARDIASQCGGCGGGHETRAGAILEASQIECFKKGLRKAIPA
ncbi:MAG: DHH family phosphoesterase [Methanomicrobiales archaeon]|nr:DHH family phosphoesterase [Methanomicrobiales archaeon]